MIQKTSMIQDANQSTCGPNVVITYPFPLGHADGGARMTREIARNLGMQGAKVSIVAVSRGAGPRQRFPRAKAEEKFLGLEFDQELAENSVEIIRVPQHPLHWRLDSLSVKKSLKEILNRQRIDIVLSYFSEATYLPSFLRSHGVKFGYIATWQSYDLTLRRDVAARGYRGLIEKRFNDRSIVQPYRQADIIFATSHFTRNELEDIVGVDKNRIHVCYLGVDSNFTTIPKNRPDEINRFVFVGRIRASKGILDAFEALGKLTKNGMTNWSFRIVGGAGEYGMGLARNAAEQHGIADKVIFCGEKNDEELRRELEQAHIGIMPSHAESFGLAIAEAQAAGLPVIAYEVAAVPEVVENGVTGWLAPFGQVDDLARCIKTAVDNPQETYRVGLAARQRVEEKFTWAATARRILNGIASIS